jgi:hypothetical protein
MVARASVSERVQQVAGDRWSKRPRLAKGEKQKLLGQVEPNEKQTEN